MLGMIGLTCDITPSMAKASVAFGCVVVLKIYSRGLASVMAEADKPYCQAYCPIYQTLMEWVLHERTDTLFVCKKDTFAK
jgi:hypothetical protein